VGVAMSLLWKKVEILAQNNWKKVEILAQNNWKKVAFLFVFLRKKL
jgi:hypothetical protein